jgi:serine/threonine protein kinase/HEAT repeat protein
MKVCRQCSAAFADIALTCPNDQGALDKAETLPAGARLGAYRIVRLLGEGGMGWVYEASHDVLGRRAALKMLRSELAQQPDIVRRFLNEAKAVNVIDHANIINVYDYGDGSGGTCVYFVMEYLEGETLGDFMDKRRPLSPPLLLHVFTQVMRAIAAGHAKKVVHRDLKPANVYIIAREDNPRFVKVLDFGIAQLRGDGAGKHQHTALGTVMGTAEYMSPEQISGGAVDARTDVWALGVMLYEAATGVRPFVGEGFHALAAVIQIDTPAKPSLAAPAANITPALDALIMSCLERDLDARCASVADLLRGLDRVKGELGLDDRAITVAVATEAGKQVTSPIPTPAPAGSPHTLAAAPARASTPTPTPTQSRKPVAVALGGLALAAVALVGYLALGRGGKPAGAPAQPAVTREAPAQASAAPAQKETIAAALSAGNAAHARELAQGALRTMLASNEPGVALDVVDALALVSTPQTAPLLEVALEGAPELRVRAARALGALALPETAPKLRAALEASGDRVRVELAAPLLVLGDKDARPILVRALGDPGMRLTAASAFAEVGDAAAQPVLADVLAATPPGGETWRRAAAGLAKLGDAKARAALADELAQADPVRAIGAAVALARSKDDRGRVFLARLMADPGFARHGDAALALAKLGDLQGVAWAKTALSSMDASERKLAIACAARGSGNGDRAELAEAIAKLATDDPDRGVRSTAVAALLSPALTGDPR